MKAGIHFPAFLVFQLATSAQGRSSADIFRWGILTLKEAEAGGWGLVSVKRRESL